MRRRRSARFTVKARISPWPAAADPFLSLESLDDPAVSAWVDAQNARTRARWGENPQTAALAARLADAYLPRERPVIPSRWGDWAYDLWDDADNPKGLWRRARWADWRARAPQWQTLLDFDALGAAEGEPWVCAGIDILYPDGDRALIALSRGGADAIVWREFDIEQRAFVADGFAIGADGKHTLSWIDRDTVYAGWDGGLAMLTRSGYPREVRRWTRGTPLGRAPVVFRGEFDDISVEADYDPLEARHTLVRSVDFFDSYTYRLDAQRRDWVRYELPPHVEVGAWHGWLMLEPRLDWRVGGRTWPGGALLAIREEAFLAGARAFTPLFVPGATTSACDWNATRNVVIVSWLDDVQSRTMLWQPEPGEAGAYAWRSRAFPVREGAQVEVSPVEETLDDTVYVDVDDYLRPPEYWFADLAADDLRDWELIDRWPTQFDASAFAVRRGHARSADGTRVPYTVIGPRTLPAAGPGACLLTGYGGFSIALTPQYLVDVGIGWLEQGGVYVVAHIRGGGEYGSAWHTGAQRALRQRAFDDFIAVAEQLIADGVTTAAQLGIRGDSNGGLLVAACMVQRPELFGAVVSEVPLTDMRRYPLLHAGASWLDEYGDPDPRGQSEEARALAAYSPYHRVRADATYPPVLFTTSTRDDRVHPAHARKMAARMQQQGHAQVWYLENADGGHGAGTDALERASYDALVFRFLAETLGAAGR